MRKQQQVLSRTGVDAGLMDSVHYVRFRPDMPSLQGTSLAVVGVAVYNLSFLPVNVMHLICGVFCYCRLLDIP